MPFRVQLPFASFVTPPNFKVQLPSASSFITSPLMSNAFPVVLHRILKTSFIALHWSVSHNSIRGDTVQYVLVLLIPVFFAPRVKVRGEIFESTDSGYTQNLTDDAIA